MTKLTKAQQAERAEAIDTLRAILPPGSTVWTNLRHVSRSGMLRKISVHVPSPDGGILDVTYLASLATGFPMDRDTYALKVGGAGMDMGFHVVYGLSRALYPDGHPCTGSDGRTPTGKRSKVPACPSNDHSNDYGRLANQFADANPELYAREWLNSTPEEERHDARVAYVAARAEWMDAQRPSLYSKRRQHADGGYALNQRWL